MTNVPKDKASTESILERTTVRIAIAAMILGALTLVTVVSQRGDGSSSPALSGGAVATPSAHSDSTAELGIGPADDLAPILKRAAPDFALRDASGQVVRLSDLKGKVVWVNFWATWCVPCKQELPDIQKVYAEKHDEGLEVLEVNYQEDVATATEFFAARSLTLPMLLDNSGSVYEQYRLQGLPDSFFIDRDGNLAALQFGFLTEAKMRERLAAAGLP